jgi:hypothetical protein
MTSVTRAKHAGVLENPMFDEQISDIFGTLIGLSGALVICDPFVAKRLVEQGYDTKEKVANSLWKNTTLRVKDYKVEAFVDQFDYPRAIKGLETWASWYKLPDDAEIPRWPRPAMINAVVVGGQTNPYYQVANMSYVRSISIDNWM